LCAVVFIPYKYLTTPKTNTFTDKLKDIVTHVNSDNHTWKAEYNNRFDNHNEESVKQFLGLKEKSELKKLELKQRNIRNIAKWND